MQSILDRILKHDIHRQAAKKTAPKTGANVLDFLGHFQKWLTHIFYIFFKKNNCLEKSFRIKLQTDKYLNGVTSK